MPKTTHNGPSNAAADAAEADRRMSMAEYLAPAEPVVEVPAEETEGGEQPSAADGTDSSASSGKRNSKRTGSGGGSRRRAPTTGNP